MSFQSEKIQNVNKIKTFLMIQANVCQYTIYVIPSSCQYTLTPLSVPYSKLYLLNKLSFTLKINSITNSLMKDNTK